MPRIKTPLISLFPFHITARSPNRAAFPVPLPELWTIFENQLFYAHHVHGLKIHQFVLMPNHFHLVATSDEISIGVVMNYFMREISKEMNLKSGKINQNFGGKHYRTLVANPHYAMNVYKYVYQNPVRAGLSYYCEQWPWSTLHRIFGFAHLAIPMESDSILFNPDFDETALKWLNQRSDQQLLEELRRYLKKGLMGPTTNRQTGRPSEL